MSLDRGEEMRHLNLIIKKRIVCKACGHILEFENHHARIDYTACLMVMTDGHCCGRIWASEMFISVEKAKEWGNEISHELNRPIFETEVQN